MGSKPGGPYPYDKVYIQFFSNPYFTQTRLDKLLVLKKFICVLSGRRDMYGNTDF